MSARTYIALIVLTVFVLGFAIGYMIGYKDGRKSVKRALNELYGKFGDSGITGFWCARHSGIWVVPNEMCHICIAEEKSHHES